jgi:SAM-dependent methyltransferase
MSELIEIFEKYSLDKLYNKYDKLYVDILKDTKHSFKNILEVGIGTIDQNKASSMHYYRLFVANDYTFGNSLRAWRDYFINADIYGIDIDENTMFEEERIKTFCSSSIDVDSMRSILEKLPQFDMIVDDGLHTMEANLETLKNCFPHLKNGGIYIIEDVNQENDLYLEDLLKDSRFLDTIKDSQYIVHSNFIHEHTRIITIKKF